MAAAALIAVLLAPRPAAAAGDTAAAVAASYDALTAPPAAGWPDVSPAAAAQGHRRMLALRTRLATLPPDDDRDGEAALTRRLLAWRIDTDLAGDQFDEARIPFDNGDGFFNTANYAAQTTVLRDEAAARAWIARLRALPAYYAAVEANMRRGIATGFVAARPTAQAVAAILDLAAAQPARQSPLLAPLATLPASMPAAARAALRAQTLAAVGEAVKPAQQRIAAFFRQTYLPRARATGGASALPDGRAYYRFAVRRSTTLPLDPDEVFAIGEREIARTRAGMDAARAAAGYAGPLPAFLAMLRRDPRFYAPDLGAYVAAASEVGVRIQGQLPRWFGTLPRLPWTIRVKPPELDASSGGYNLGDPAAGIAGAVVVGRNSFHDPLFGLPAWILHEGVPGHHLQIALAQERTDLPAFRRRDEPTAFVEGWGLYAEGLGEEMGIYRTPYERIGRLSFAMWRACRLVMDVGLHWKGWSVAQAEACLRDNTALPEAIVESETQRYLAWPAQALAYKIGELRFRDERARAEAALGKRFDIRRFHDMLLDDGPMPLGVLHDRVAAWIDAQGSAG